MAIYEPFSDYSNSFFTISYDSNIITPGNDRTHNYFTHSNQKNNAFEILIFLKGNASFFVEGNMYPLSPGDIVFVNSTEYHNIVHHAKGEYNRILLFIKTDFFNQPGCKKYEMVFTQRTIGEGNHIPHNSELGNKLESCLKKLISYINQDTQPDILIYNTFLEFLQLMNLTPPMPSKRIAHGNVRRVLSYIDEHFTENITLESIAEYFFMSKTYLCHVFKRHVGYTVTQYIIKKRVDLVTKLRQSGMPLKSAATAAGFKNYVSYYRAYRNLSGNKPSDITPYGLDSDIESSI